MTTYEFDNFYPTEETAQKLHDELTYQAAVQVYLWSLPLADIAAIRNSQREEAGVENTGVFVTDKFLTTKTVVPTGNQETVYAHAVITLDDEPIVMEVVPGVLGFLVDVWCRPIDDIGPLGPDKGQGGNYLLVPPGYEGDLPDGYFIQHAPTKNVWWLLRAFAHDGKPDSGVAALSQVKIYPLSQADNPPPQQIVNESENPHYAIPPRGFAYWERLAEVLSEEPVQERDRIMMGMAAHIGMEKGKPFSPDSHLKAILMKAEETGFAMAASLGYATRVPEAKAYEDRQWEFVYLTQDPAFDADNYLQIYRRAGFMFQAIGSAKAMVIKKVGVGSKYIGTYRDIDGAYLDGSQTYLLHVPANPPAKHFWSVAVYDAETRSLIHTDRPSATRHSNMPLDQNDDGSFTLYFGPEMPAAGEANWVKTIPGKGFFLYFRFYGPLESFFDKTWKPGDVEKVK